MRFLLAVAAVLLLCVASSEGTQRMFLGGTFSGLDGIRSEGFAAFDAEKGQYLEQLSDPDATILDLDAVRGGVFVGGTFTNIADMPSSHLGFWDGQKWCAVRQGVDGDVTSVWCDSDTSCWVAGSFSQVLNLQDSDAVANFAHYIFDEAANEWVFDSAQRGWSYTSGNRISGRVDDVSLVVFPGSKYFFLSTGGWDGSEFVNTRTIWRGSKNDNGFFVFVDGSVFAGLTIRDFSIDLSVETPVLYMVTNNNTDQVQSNLKSNIGLTFPCGSDPCSPPLTTPTNYTEFASLSVNATILSSYLRVFAAPNDVRYIIGDYDPDGLGSEFSSRQRVLSQTGTAAPVLVGAPFEQGTGTTFLQTATPLSLLHDGRLVAQGSFSTANLYYPPTPLTTDASGVTGDVRALDLVTGLAVWNGTIWQQAFGGGFGSSGHQSVRWVLDNSSNIYYFAGGSIRYAYNTRADKAAWFDDDESLNTQLFALFDRNVLTRNEGGVESGSVWSIVCDTSACSDVFVGGDFTFHGAEVIGSVAKVEVSREGPAVPTEVGGGLWQVLGGHYDPDVAFQHAGGSVFELTRDGDYLYAAGFFQRGGPTTAYVCLNNIARINVATVEASAWEDLDGGCDNEVYDLAFYAGSLHAAGAFTRCGGANAYYVAAYDHQSASPSWSSLRGGVDDTAYSLEPFQGRLIVGGDFSLAGGIPVRGVASWDGFKWRALLPACTDDCVGTRPYYFDALSNPSSVYDLRADPSGDFLWGRGFFPAPITKRGVSDSLFLVRWEYTDGDLGHWTAKGDQLNYEDEKQLKGQSVAFLSGDVVIVAGDPDNNQFRYANGHISPFNTQLENWYAGFRTQSDVFVLAEGVGAAASLQSPLAALLAYF